MKHNHLTAFAISTLLVTAIASNCIAQSQAVKTMGSSDWGPAVDDLQFRAVPVKPEFAVDKPVLVTLEIKTIGSQPISYGDNRQPIKAFKIVLTDASGHPVPFTRYGKLVQAEANFDPHFSYMNRLALVRPGYTVKYHFWINRMYDMTIPGEYHITFSRSDIVAADVTSNAGVIRIVESKNFDTPETNLDLPNAEPL